MIVAYAESVHGMQESTQEKFASGALNAIGKFRNGCMIAMAESATIAALASPRTALTATPISGKENLELMAKNTFAKNAGNLQNVLDANGITMERRRNGCSTLVVSADSVLQRFRQIRSLKRRSAVPRKKLVKKLPDQRERNHSSSDCLAGRD